MKALKRLILEELAKAYGKDTTSANDPTVPISKAISESDPLANPKPVQLKDDSKMELVGDPVEDIKLNGLIDHAEADENILGLYGVKPGTKKTGNQVTSGQAKPQFNTKKGAKQNKQPQRTK